MRLETVQTGLAWMSGTAFGLAGIAELPSDIAGGLTSLLAAVLVVRQCYLSLERELLKRTSGTGREPDEVEIRPDGVTIRSWYTKGDRK